MQRKSFDGTKSKNNTTIKIILTKTILKKSIDSDIIVDAGVFYELYLTAGS